MLGAEWKKEGGNRKEKEGEDEEGEWIESNYFFFSLSPYPSRLLLVLLDNISDKPEERRTDRHNTHFGSEIKFT